MLKARASFSTKPNTVVTQLRETFESSLSNSLNEIQERALNEFRMYLRGELEVNGRKIHVRTGRLLQNSFVEVVKRPDGNFELQIGSRVPYAIYVFRGTRVMPPRPADLKVAEDIVKWLRQAF